jgi:hypothetical protein
LTAQTLALQLKSAPSLDNFVFFKSGLIMRHTIDIDEKLLAEVMKFMGTRTKRETVRRAVEAAVSSYKPWSNNLPRKMADPKGDPNK